MIATEVSQVRNCLFAGLFVFAFCATAWSNDLEVGVYPGAGREGMLASAQVPETVWPGRWRWWNSRGSSTLGFQRGGPIRRVAGT